MYEKYLKRCLDLILSLCAFLLLLPLLLLLCAVGAAVLRGNPIFIQRRAGRKDPRTGRERIFYLIKFRTMTDERDKNGGLLPDARRLVPYGAWLRRTSLDELPELINIIAGDLALVGPRPLVESNLPLYTEEQRRRHDVRPGLTGYAQAHGRNSLSWEEKFRLDLWYVDHVGFRTDMKILRDTVKTVLRREGINSAGEVSGGEFRGSSGENGDKRQENRKQK